MPEGFLPPVVFELAADTAKFSSGMTRSISKLKSFGAAVEETAGPAVEAFGAIAKAAEDMAASVAESADVAKKSIRQIASAARALNKSVATLAETAPEQLAAVGTAATEMGAATSDAFAKTAAAAKDSAVSIKAAAAATDEAAVAAEGAAVKTEASTGRLAAASDTAFGGVASGLKKYALGLAAAGGVGIFEAVKGATDFQSQMTKLQTAAGLTDEQLKAMGLTSDGLNRQVLALGDQLGLSGEKMAEALYHPISASLDLKSSLEVVKYAAEETKISGASLDDTTYSLSSVMKAFNFQASEAGPTMATLNAIVGQGDMRFQDFNQSVKNWAPTAAQMGISVQSMGAGLAYLTDRGNSAEVAATRMTMGIAMMTTPSKQAADMLISLGDASGDVKASSEAMKQAMEDAHITQNDLARDLQKPDGLYVALNHLKTSLEQAGVSGTEADSVLAKIFGGGRSDKAIMSLMQNLDGLKAKYQDIGNAANMNAFGDAYQKSQQTFQARLEQLKATFENIGITVGTILMPYIEKFLGWIQKGITWIAQHKQAVEALAVTLGTVLVGAVVALGAAMFASFGWVEVIAMAIVAVGAGILYAYNHFKVFHDIVNAVGSTIKTVFLAAWHAAGAVIDWFRTTVLPPLEAGLRRIISWFSQHSSEFSTAWRQAINQVHAVVQWFDQNVLTWLRARLAELVKWWDEHHAQIAAVTKSTYVVISTIFKALWDGAIRPTLALIIGAWHTAWGIVFDAVKIAWSLISGVVMFGIHQVKNIIDVVLDILTGNWGKAWADLKRLVSQALSDVTSTIGNVAAGFGHLLWDAGANIIKGLIGGIKSMAGGAGNAIKDVVSGIRQYLPFSPAKVGPLSGSGSPDIAGAKIGSMLATGIQASVPTVSQATNRLAGGALIGVGTAGRPLAGTATGGPTYVVNLTVQGSVLSERDLRGVVEQQMYQLGMRGSQTWQPYQRR